MSAPTLTQPPRFKLALASLVLLIPLVAGAVFASVAGLNWAKAWSPQGQETGAPTDVVTAEDLVEARRSTGEAVAQAGFLVTGTQELADGTGQLNDGAGQLGSGIEELAAGSQQLVDGMVQLQAGTGQLGAGATELADGVQAAVDQIVGLEAVRGQLLTTIDGTLEDLRGNDSQDARDMREQLRGLRNQVDTFEVGDNITGPLNELKDGSRELSNQLDVPGYAYHDGVYSATEGAKALNEGIKELQRNAGEAVDGVGQLDEGAQQIKSMADQNKSRVDDIQRALPVLQTAQAAEEEGYSLSPAVAFLIASVVMLGGMALGVLWSAQGRRSWVVTAVGLGALAVIAPVLMFVLAPVAPPALPLVMAGVVALLASAASAGATCVLLRAFGFNTGLMVSVVLGVIQLTGVGLLLGSLSPATSGGLGASIADVSPLAWATKGLTVLGNDGNQALLWAACAILAVVAVLAAVLLRVFQRPEPVAA